MKLTKKQKNYLIKIAIVVVLAIVAYFIMPEEEGKKGSSNDDTELSADTGDVTGDAQESDKDDDDVGNDDSEEDGDDKKEEDNSFDKEEDQTDDAGNNDIGNEDDGSTWVEYEFRKDEYLTEHFEKHGDEFDYANEDEYLAGANKVINSKDALHKTEAEDGDYIYYIKASNEFVVVSKDGYIRTYFKPSAGIDYYNRQ